MALNRKKHATPPLGYVEGDIVNGRTYTLHPTKGWRSRAIRERFDERGLHPFVIHFRRLCARAGFAV